MKMKLHIDKEADALYLRLDDSEIIESDEVSPGVILDFNASNQVVRVEMLNLYYPRLAQAGPEQLKQVTLRVGGRALRWEELDEDIWVTDAVCQNYPKSEASATRLSSRFDALTAQSLSKGRSQWQRLKQSTKGRSP